MTTNTAKETVPVRSTLTVGRLGRTTAVQSITPLIERDDRRNTAYELRFPIGEVEYTVDGAAVVRLAPENVVALVDSMQATAIRLVAAMLFAPEPNPVVPEPEPKVSPCGWPNCAICG